METIDQRADAPSDPRPDVIRASIPLMEAACTLVGTIADFLEWRMDADNRGLVARMVGAVQDDKGLDVSFFDTVAPHMRILNLRLIEPKELAQIIRNVQTRLAEWDVPPGRYTRAFADVYFDHLDQILHGRRRA